MNNLRQRLKQFSAGLHQQVDEVFSALELESPAGYRRFLLAHAEALFSLEPALEHNAIERLLEDWSRRRRRWALLDDLRALGCADAVPAQAAQPMPMPPGWCWGVAYVLEGSRLGAQLLLRRLQKAQPAAPARYLGHASGESLWTSFLYRLEADAASCAERDLRRGVEDAFSLFLTAAHRQNSCLQGRC